MRRLAIFFILSLVLMHTSIAHAADATSFNPVPLAIKGTGGIPVGTIISWPVAANPADMVNWLECNGQTINSANYPALRALIGNKVPDYRNQFLRGGSVAQVGQVAADSMRSHAHAMAQHNHTVSGSASGQMYSKPVTGGGNGVYIDAPTTSRKYAAICPGYWDDRSSSDDDSQMFYVEPVTHYIDSYSYNGFKELIFEGMGKNCRNATLRILQQAGSGATVSATTGGGTLTGFTDMSGPASTHTSGSSETAPQHTRIRYFIRALP